MDWFLPLMLGLALAAGALVVALALINTVGKGSADFEIRRRADGQVEVRGRIPQAKVPAIRSFFGSELGTDQTCRVQGRFGPNRLLRLDFRGGLSAGQQQQVRNFLLEHLR